MAAASCLLTEDQFLCSICLDVFTDPVSTPCGHNFCKICITRHWDTNVPSQCPLCKQVFCTRPELRVNTFISQMAAQFRDSAHRAKVQSAKPGEVHCDICTGTKLKAMKSCLVCLVSYCETHLEPHLTVTGLKGHQVVDPVVNLESRLCKKHNKPLELFCKDDQTFVCALCTAMDRRTHTLVTLRDAHEGKKPELEKTRIEIQKMVELRCAKMDEFKLSIKLSNEDADRAEEAGVQFFTFLRHFAERGQNQVITSIEGKKKETEKQAEDFITELEQERLELIKRKAEIEQLLSSEDDLDFLQRCQTLTLSAAPNMKDWTKARISTPVYEATVRTVLGRSDEWWKDSEQQFIGVEKQLSEAELKKVQRFAVDVTLDPNTVHPELILSEDGKQVEYGNERKYLLDNPERFSRRYCVLGKHGLSSGRFYFEVGVKEKTKWVVGVATQSVNKKRENPLSPQEGYWVIGLINTKYTAYNDPPDDISVESELKKVGVFVDYEKRLVSFYNVDHPGHIYSFTGCSFTQQLYPLLSPGSTDRGKNCTPLIITPVRHNK